MFRKDFKKFIQLRLSKIKAFYGDNLVSLVLFGSQARGRERPDSPIDLLIVLNKALKSRHKRIETFGLIEENLEPELQNLRQKGIHAWRDN